MKKKIIALSLCCSCILNAGWYEDAKAKADELYESSKNSTKEAYDNSKAAVSKTAKDTEEKYDNYQKEKDQAAQLKIDQCMSSMQESLPKYGLFLEQNYMDVNSRSEAKILMSYKKLTKKGISSDLKSSMDPLLLEKLAQSKSTLEYMNIVISALKNVEKRLKENKVEELDSLIKQTQFLMFAWTTPLEVLSTKNIYDSSLLLQSSELFKNLNKNNYINYTEFIYSMLYVNLMNENIVIQKDSALVDMPKAATGVGLLASFLAGEEPTIEDKKGLEAICVHIVDSILEKDPNDYLLDNFSSALNIDRELLMKDINIISKQNNLFNSAVMFDKNVKGLNEISIIDNPLNDNWYIMVREYMELQNDFYNMKKELEKIIKILNVLPDTSRYVAVLKQNLFDVDALYRKFDEVVRYNVIDLPISIYADLYYIEFQKGKKWYNDDENAMGDIAVAYNKSCANMQKYMVSEFAISKVMRITKALKSEFDEETEWKEIKTRAKLTQDWFNMLNKIEIKNK